ncbi:MAG: hypothetical protein WA231_09680 [Methylocella sp.]
MTVPKFERLLSCLVEGNQGWAKHVPVLALGIVSLKFAKNGKEKSAAVHDLGLAAGNLVVEATARGLHVHQRAKSLESRKATRHGPELRSATKVIPPRCRTISSSAT